MKHPFLLATLLLPLACPPAQAAPSTTGTTLTLRRTWGGLLPTENFGAVVACPGDVDGDSTDDTAIADPGYFPPALPPPPVFLGRVQVYSGRTGALLWSVTNPGLTGAFGNSLGAAGDIDGDGHPDLAVGTPTSPGGFGVVAGNIRVLSGRNGQLLLDWTAPPSAEVIGSRLAPAGDVDGDGYPDILAGSRSTNIFVVTHPLLLSGRTGQPIHQWTSGQWDDGFGMAVAAPGDLDQDGTPDVVIGAPYDGAYTPLPIWGRVYAYSGRTGALIWTRDGNHGQPYHYPTSGLTPSFGYALAAAGDRDADGVPDLLAGSPGDQEIHLLSGVNGRILRSYGSPTHMGYVHSFGRWAAVVDDFLLVHSPLENNWNGVVHVFKCSTGAHLASCVGDPSIVGTLGGEYGNRLAVGRLRDGTPTLAVGAIGAGPGFVVLPGITNGPGEVYLYAIR